MFKSGQTVRITPHGAARRYGSFCKAFAGVTGRFIRMTLTSLDRTSYPEEFAIIAIGKKENEQFLTVDSRWLSATS